MRKKKRENEGGDGKGGEEGRGRRGGEGRKERRKKKATQEQRCKFTAMVGLALVFCILCSLESYFSFRKLD